MTTVEILAFTDPVCTWCWGSEPVLRKIETSYGDAVRIRPVMGGLVKDLREFYDSANDIGGDPETSNAQIVRHWLEASARHGMPVRAEDFRLFSAEIVSTYPQNMAVKAAELTDPHLGPRYLRRVREASAAEARETGRQEVLIELANEIGLDVAAFIARLNDGSAERAFQEDLAMTQRYQARGFPTFVFRCGACELKLRGYQDFRTMQAVIATLTDGDLQAKSPDASPENVLAFLKKYGNAAAVEVATVFDLSSHACDSLLAGLEEAGLIRRKTAGNGNLWLPVAYLPSCDLESGTCTLMM